MKTKKIAFLGLLLGIAVIINYIESFIPFLLIPGSKLGFSNIIIMIILYKYGFKDSFTVLILRIFIIGIFKGNLFMYPFYMSLFGGLFSILIMTILKKLNIFSEIGVSVCGAITHSIVQVIVAIIFIDTFEIIYYLPYLLLVSLITGLLVGIITKKINTFTVFNDIKE